MEQESRTAQEERLKTLWYNRCPVHENNADTGVDMFWGTLLCVFDDYSRERVEAMEKEKKELKLEIDGCYYAYEVFKLTIASLESKLSTLEELNKELWSLWESMAECGELQIGPQFSAQYKILKEKLKG